MTLRKIDFFVPGRPQAKQRARAGRDRRTGKSVHYTPTHTSNYEQAVELYCRAVTRSQKPIPGPVHMTLRIYMPISKNWPMWKQNAALDGFIHPTVDPDTTNVAKAVEDALNNVAYLDDNQIVSQTILKQYAPADMQGVRVTVEELDGYRHDVPREVIAELLGLPPRRGVSKVPAEQPEKSDS